MKRLATVITLVAATLTISAAAYGQNRASDLKRRIFDQARAATPQPATPNAEVLLPSAHALPPKNALAGTWNVVLTFSDGSEVHSTLQLMTGAADGVGAAIHASEFSFAPPNPTLPEQGSWRHVQGSQFAASYYGYSYDGDFQPFGKIGFRHLITLSRDQTRFNGQAVFEVLDLMGNVLFSDNVETVGVRQQATAP